MLKRCEEDKGFKALFIIKMKRNSGGWKPNKDK